MLPRGRIIAEINGLGREMSTATVVFHQAVAEKAGLSGTDHKYVDLLFRHGSMTAGELAEHAGLTTGAVTGVIDRLEKAGLVRRERDPADRRKVVVALDEEAARERISPAFQHMQQGLGQLYEGFSDQELGVVKRYLESTIAFYEGQIKHLREE
ncbi:MAG: MarR family transcriptional regulator [Lewinellaceae bacterium]|nr:MarR family transcriptional regulator [Lewinellaceae bacterium]